MVMPWQLLVALVISGAAEAIAGAVILNSSPDLGAAIGAWVLFIVGVVTSTQSIREGLGR